MCTTADTNMMGMRRQTHSNRLCYAKKQQSCAQHLKQGYAGIITANRFDCMPLSVDAHGQAHVRGVVMDSQVVTRQNHNVLNNSVLDVLKQPRILPDSICCALEPHLVCGRLGCRQNLNKAITTKADTRAKVVCSGQMPVQ